MRKTPFNKSSLLSIYNEHVEESNKSIILKCKSIRYSFTITLKPRIYNVPAEDQFDQTAHSLRAMLHSMNATFTLIAEITQNMNIHFHGTIQLPLCKNVRKKFIDSFRNTKFFGYVNIKDITEEPGWIEYISKSLQDTQTNIDRRPILKDDFNYFNEEIRAKHAEQW